MHTDGTPHSPDSPVPGNPPCLTLTHCLRIALLSPQIAPNTGNIARLCVATGIELHLIRPMGFVLSDRHLRRSAMDYWPRLRLTVHDDLPSFLDFSSSSRLWLTDSTGQTSLWDARFSPGDTLLFGSETHGLPDSLLSAHTARVLRVPQVVGERCLNLSSAAAVVAYEALRQVSARV
jgi:tRNA (cytidine/uridine-2'-O-)-methyltransferase